MLTRLSALRRAARFYPMDHPAVADAVARFGDTVHVYHDEGVDVQLAFFEGEILLGSQLLAEESMLFDQLGRDMRDLGIGSMVLRVGLSGNELLRASRILAADVGEAQAAGGAARMAAEENLPHVQFASVQMVAAPSEEFESEEPIESPRGAMGNAVALLREVDLLRQNNRLVSAGHVNGVVRSLVDNVLANRYAMLQLTALRNYDEYTFFHSANVAILSLALGSSVSEDHRFLSSLGVGALLHDIGKLTIDPAAAQQAGHLDAGGVGPRCGSTRSPAPRWSRSFPGWTSRRSSRSSSTTCAGTAPATRRAPRGDSSTSCSRIVAIADAYDAMTSRRSYSAARVEDEAMLNIAQGAGTAFDPELVRLFVEHDGRSTRRARWCGCRRAPSRSCSLRARRIAARPVVRVIAAPDGELVRARGRRARKTRPNSASPRVSTRGCSTSTWTTTSDALKECSWPHRSRQRVFVLIAAIVAVFFTIGLPFLSGLPGCGSTGCGTATWASSRSS